MSGSGQTTIAVLGAGAWGTALAATLQRKGHGVRLWCRNAQTAEAINLNCENPKYLPGITLPKGISATTALNKAVTGASLVLMVTPAQSVPQVGGELAGQVSGEIPVVLCAKGIDRQTGLLPAESLKLALPDNPVAALSGPSFATDVARQLPTAVTLAANDPALAAELAEFISSQTFRVYASSDLKGVELGGALKNVIALAVGVCRGLELGASAEAALIARGFAELTRLATALGARPKTLMGLSGLGDLVLTCSSLQSRNFSYGIVLAKGGERTHLPLAEGALTAAIAARLARDNQLDCPIMETIVSLLDGEISASQAVQSLLARPLRTESE